MALPPIGFADGWLLICAEHIAFQPLNIPAADQHKLVIHVAQQAFLHMHFNKKGTVLGMPVRSIEYSGLAVLVI
ncbi:hypothetical protein D3C78_1881480 [compost metagenome]